MVGINNRFVFFGTLLTVAVSLSGQARAEISPYARQRIRTLVTERLRKCYDEFYDTVPEMRDGVDKKELQQDIDTLCGVLSDEFPSVFMEELDRSLQPCNDACAGLREKITCHDNSYGMKCRFLGKYLSDVFHPGFWDETEKSRENFEYKLRLRKGDRSGFKISRREIAHSHIVHVIIRSEKSSEYSHTKQLRLEERLKNFIKDSECLGFEDDNPGKFKACRRLIAIGFYRTGTRYDKHIEYDPSHIFNEEFVYEISSLIYPECMSRLSPKARLYHRMFLFFDQYIPETDAALFYGEEVFRLSLRHEHIRRDVRNKTVDGRTHRLADRFAQLADRLVRLRNFMSCIAEADVKARSVFGRLDGNSMEFAARDNAFLDNMRRKLEARRKDLQNLQEDTGIVLGSRAYSDGNWWKPHHVDEEEGRKILEEIE